MRRTLAALMATCILLPLSGTAAAQTSDCRRAVVFTLPGVTWEMVEKYRPPNLLRIAEQGSAGLMSVRTNSSRTSHASGFVTIGAGTRTDGGVTAGSVAFGPQPLPGPFNEPAPVFIADTEVGGFPEIRDAAGEATYVSTPGALADALVDPLVAIGTGDAGDPPPTPLGGGSFALLAAMDSAGVVDAAAVGRWPGTEPGIPLLIEDPAAPFGLRTDTSAIERYVDVALGPKGRSRCTSAVIDQGDLLRVDTAALLTGEPSDAHLRDALLAADELLGHVESLLTDEDLLLVVSPTSPWWDEEVHLGVAVAKGPGFPPGSTMQSASTRQKYFVTLPDVAPTILDHLGIDRPASMLGRPIVPIEVSELDVADLDALDRESVFAHGVQVGISAAFVIFQIAVYAFAIFLLSRREKKAPRERRETAVTWLRRAGLGIVAFPFASYLASPIPAHRLGTPLFVACLIAIDVVVVVAVSRLLRDPLERLLAITAATIALFIIDLAFLQGLQLNAVWGNDPIVAGRFTGLGNIAFAILGSSSLMTGALLVHRFPDQRWVFWVVAALFAATVVVDGAPQLGSDVGGVLALVPALGVTFILLSGKRPTARTVLLVALGALAALALFLLIDLARPPESRTHLARLIEDIRGRGASALFEALGRKIETNLRVFRSTIWTYLVPPALGVIAWLLLRPRGRWHELAVGYPKLRAGLIGGLLLAVLGFSVNDSGIVVPAMVLSFLVPMSLLLHLAIERDRMSQEATG
ncbi:MAG: hypothetical protein ACLGHL_04305 [Actinomycetota bacterium]